MTKPYATFLGCLLLLGGCNQVEDATFEYRLRAYLLEHPEVIQEAAVKLRDDKARAAAATLRAAQARLEHDPRDFVANPGGGVTVVQFFDYRCTYCKAAAPEIDRLIAENPDVRFVFKQYPVFGSASEYAARTALTPQGKAKGLALHRAFMAQKDLTPARADALARAAGLDPAALQQATQDPAIAQQIQDTRVLAQEIRVAGTPAFVVGPEVIQGADIQRLRAAIIRARGAALGAVGEALTRVPQPAG